MSSWSRHTDVGTYSNMPRLYCTVARGHGTPSPHTSLQTLLRAAPFRKAANGSADPAVVEKRVFVLEEAAATTPDATPGGACALAATTSQTRVRLEAALDDDGDWPRRFRMVVLHGPAEAAAIELPCNMAEEHVIRCLNALLASIDSSDAAIDAHIEPSAESTKHADSRGQRRRMRAGTGQGAATERDREEDASRGGSDKRDETVREVHGEAQVENEGGVGLLDLIGEPALHPGARAAPLSRVTTSAPTQPTNRSSPPPSLLASSPIPPSKQPPSPLRSSPPLPSGRNPTGSKQSPLSLRPMSPTSSSGLGRVGAASPVGMPPTSGRMSTGAAIRVPAHKPAQEPTDVLACVGSQRNSSSASPPAEITLTPTPHGPVCRVRQLRVATQRHGNACGYHCVHNLSLLLRGCEGLEQDLVDEQLVWDSIVSSMTLLKSEAKRTGRWLSQRLEDATADEQHIRFLVNALPDLKGRVTVIPALHSSAGGSVAKAIQELHLRGRTGGVGGSAAGAFGQSGTLTHGFILGATQHWVAALLVRRVSGDFELLLCDSSNKPMSMSEAAFHSVSQQANCDGLGQAEGAGDGVQVPERFLEGADMMFTGPAAEIDRADLEQKAAMLDECDRARFIRRLRTQKQWEHRPHEHLEQAFDDGVREYWRGKLKNSMWWRFQPKSIRRDLLAAELYAVRTYTKAIVDLALEQ